MPWLLAGSAPGTYVASKQSRLISRKMPRPETRRTMPGSLRAPLGAKPAECSCDSRGRKKFALVSAGSRWNTLRQPKRLWSRDPQTKYGSICSLVMVCILRVKSSSIMMYPCQAAPEKAPEFERRPENRSLLRTFRCEQLPRDIVLRAAGHLTVMRPN